MHIRPTQQAAAWLVSPASVARDANEIAGVPFARIVAAEEIGTGQPGPTDKGDG
jgi:hypothetical protein